MGGGRLFIDFKMAVAIMMLIVRSEEEEEEDVSEANILVSEASKLSAEARIFRGP